MDGNPTSPNSNGHKSTEFPTSLNSLPRVVEDENDDDDTDSINERLFSTEIIKSAVYVNQQTNRRKSLTSITGHKFGSNSVSGLNNQMFKQKPLESSIKAISHERKISHASQTLSSTLTLKTNDKKGKRLVGSTAKPTTTRLSKTSTMGSLSELDRVFNSIRTSASTNPPKQSEAPPISRKQTSNITALHNTILGRGFSTKAGAHFQNKNMSEYRKFEKELEKTLSKKVSTTYSPIDEWKAALIKQSEIYEGDIPLFSHILYTISFGFLLSANIDLSLHESLNLLYWCQKHYNIEKYPRMLSVSYGWLCQNILLAKHHETREMIAKTMQHFFQKLIEINDIEVRFIHNCTYETIRVIVATFSNQTVESQGESMKQLLVRLVDNLKIIQLKDSERFGSGRVFEAFVKCLSTSDIRVRIWTLQYLDTVFWPTDDDQVNSSFPKTLSFLAEMLFGILRVEEYPTTTFFGSSDPRTVLEIVHSITRKIFAFLTSLSYDEYPTLFFNFVAVLFRMLTFGKWNITDSSFDAQTGKEVPENGIIFSFKERPCENKIALNICNTVSEFAVVHRQPFQDALLDLISHDADIPMVILIYKRLVIDSSLKIDELLSFSYRTLITRISSYPPSRYSHELLDYLRFFFSFLLVNHEARFYQPLVSSISSNQNQRIAETIRTIDFLTDSLGELAFWFGLLNSGTGHINSISTYSIGDASFNNSNQGPIGLGLSVPAPISKVIIPSYVIPLLCVLIIGSKSALTGDSFQFSLGHAAMLMEMIWMLRKLRIAHRYGYCNVETRDSLKRCLSEVESRLKVFIVKSVTRNVPSEYKILLIEILLEIRLFCDISSRPVWLSCLIQWTVDELGSYPVDLNVFEDGILSQFHDLYSFGNENLKFYNAQNDESLSHNCFKSRLTCLFGENSMNFLQLKCRRNLAKTCLTAIIALYPSLDREDISTIFPVLWDRLDTFKHDIHHLSSFILMLSCEVIPGKSRTLIFSDAYCDNAEKRFKVIEKFDSLFYARNYYHFQEVPSNIPLNTNENRVIVYDTKIFQSAFRGYVLNIPFIAPDFGIDTSTTLSEPDWLGRLKEAALVIKQTNAATIIGKNGLQDQNGESEAFKDRRRRLERSTRLLPRLSLTDTTIDHDRKKARTVFPAVLSLSSLVLPDMLQDYHAAIHEIARESLYEMIRNDPNVFLRVVSNEFTASDLKRQEEIITRLYYIVIEQRPVPYAFAFQLVNFLIGAIKWEMSTNKKHSRSVITLCISLTSELVVSIKNLGFKDFKKGRFESILMNTGNFWFSEGSPTIFPQNYQSIIGDGSLRFHKISLVVFDICTLRMCQTHLMIQFILRNPMEVTPLRKFLISELLRTDKCSSLPESDIYSYFDSCILKDSLLHNMYELLLPAQIKCDKDTWIVNLAVSNGKMWIMFLDILFSFINRNFYDMSEMYIFFSRVNGSFLRFYRDEELFRQHLTLYLNVAFRFNRLFVRKGYHLFVAPIFALYVYLCRDKQENERLIESLQFTWRQFYNIHEESFILQSLSVILKIVSENSSVDTKNASFSQKEILKGFICLYDSLDNDIHNDPIGITHGCASYEMFSRPRNIQCPVNMNYVVRILSASIAFNPATSKSATSLKILHDLIPYLAGNKNITSTLSLTIPALLKIYIRDSTKRSNIVISNRNGAIKRDDSHANWLSYETDQNGSEVKLLLISAITTFIYTHNPTPFLHLTDFKNIALIIKSKLKENTFKSQESSTEWLSGSVKACLLTIQDESLFIEAAKVWLKVFSSAMRHYTKGIDLGGLLNSVSLLIPKANKEIIPIIKDKFYIPTIISQIIPDKLNLMKHGSNLNASVKIMALLHIHHFDVISDIERTRMNPAMQFLSNILMPFCLTFDLELKKEGVNSLRLPLELLQSQTYSSIVLFLTKFEPSSQKAKVGNDINETIPITSNFNLALTKTSTGNLRNSTVSRQVSNDVLENEKSPGSKQEGIPKRLDSAWTSICLLIIKLCLTCGRQSLITYQPGIFSHLAHYIRSSFSNRAVIRENLESMWSFLDFVYRLNTPLRYLLKSFTFEQYRYLQNHILATALPKRDSSRQITQKVKDRPLSSELSNQFANLRTIKELKDGSRGVVAGGEQPDKLLSETLHSVEESIKHSTPRKRLQSDSPIRPFPKSKDSSTPAIPAINEEYTGTLTSQIGECISIESGSNQKMRPRFLSEHQKNALNLAKTTNSFGEVEGDLGSDESSAPYPLPTITRTTSVATEESVVSSMQYNLILTGNLLIKVKNLQKKLFSNSSSDHESSAELLEEISKEFRLLKMEHP